MNYKDILGYEGLYEISECGVVRSYPRWVNSKSNSIALKKGKVMKNKINEDGDESIMLSDKKGY